MSKKIDEKTPKTTQKPRGRVENLKPIKTTAEAKEKGRAGGLKTAQKMAEKRALKDLLDLCLREMPEGGDTSKAEQIVAALVNKALTGDVKAFGMIRDTLGEAPKQGIDLTSSDGTLPLATVVDFSGKTQAELLEIVDAVYSREAQAAGPVAVEVGK